MAKIDDIKKELLAVLQKEIDLNKVDQEHAMTAYVGKRDDIDEEVKELRTLEAALMATQATGSVLEVLMKDIEARIPDSAEVRAEAEAAAEVRK